MEGPCPNRMDLWGSSCGLCLVTVTLQQTLEAVGVLPVQGQMRKGRGGAVCTVCTVGKGVGSGGWGELEEINHGVPCEKGSHGFLFNLAFGSTIVACRQLSASGRNHICVS